MNIQYALVHTTLVITDEKTLRYSEESMIIICYNSTSNITLARSVVYDNLLRDLCRLRERSATWLQIPLTFDLAYFKPDFNMCFSSLCKLFKKYYLINFHNIVESCYINVSFKALLSFNILMLLYFCKLIFVLFFRY